jgi:predicted ATP-grasp superfamily ATP-dependent carboligase
VAIGQGGPAGTGLGDVGAVVLGGDFQGLGVVRSLGEMGVPVFLIDSEWGIARYSRYVQRKIFKPDLVSDEVLPDFLLETGRQESLEGWVLFPNNDETVKLLSKHSDILKTMYRVPVPAWDVVEKFYVKNNLTRYAKRVGIPTPMEYPAGSLGELLDSDPRFPLVLKPVNKEKYYPKTKKKAVLVMNESQLKEEYGKMAQILLPSEIIVQEYIEGGTRNLFSYGTLFDGEKPVAGLAAARLRQHPMDFGKATTYAVSLKDPYLEEMAVNLLKEIGYFGIAEVEFMKDDKDGQYKLLEINGRPWGWHTLLKAAGINLPHMLFQLMTDQPIPPAEGKAGVKWVRLITDIPTVFREVVSGRMAIRDYVHSMKGGKHFAVLSASDPVPFFMEFVLIPYLWRKRGF